eukprot:GHVL01035164.1.p1 GENE.GHVL01035164.1~~GHVL01035164.1.p1  ORF type:complete len:288 (-),score=86.27 GHVL01035164.1:34-897(-)
MKNEYIYIPKMIKNSSVFNKNNILWVGEEASLCGIDVFTKKMIKINTGTPLRFLRTLGDHCLAGVINDRTLVYDTRIADSIICTLKGGGENLTAIDTLGDQTIIGLDRTDKILMWDCRYPKDPTIIFCPPLDQMTKISKNLSKKDTYNIIKKDEKNIPFWSSTAYQINKPFQINKPLHEEPLQKEPLRWLWAHKIMKPLHIIKKPLHIINNIKLDNEINKIISLPECLIIIKESIFIYNWTFYAPKMSIIFSGEYFFILNFLFYFIFFFIFFIFFMSINSKLILYLV